MTVPRVSKWKMKYLVFTVLGTEAFHDQEDLINGVPLGHPIAHKEDAWHRFSNVNAIISVAGNGVAIVR